jgi:signal transduction histidine kinase
LTPGDDTAAPPSVLVVGSDATSDRAAATLDARRYAVAQVAPESVSGRLADDAPDCLVVSATVAWRDVGDGDDGDPPVVLLGTPDGDETPGDALAAGATAFVPAEAVADGRVLAARVDGALARRTVEDLRDRRDELEDELARERTLLDAIFETVPAHLYVKDREGRHVRVSEAYVEDTEKLLGKTDWEVYEDEHTEETYSDDVRVIETGEPIIDKEEPIVSLEGDNFSVEHLHDEYDVDVDVADEWVRTSKVPWRDENGEVIGLVGVTVDVSEQRAYLDRLERQNERLEAFTSFLSHDLQNPLNVAQGYLDLVAERLDNDAPEAAHLERVADAHDRMAELIEDVLSLARQGEDVTDPEPTSLATAARTAWDTAEVSDRGTATATETAGPTLRVDVGDAAVTADEGRLRELFENLFSNAARHAGPSVTVAVGLAADGDGFYVADDGPGVPSADREAVFETGYTTAEEGTGIGLAVVQNVATAHGWDVRLTASDAGGARFEFDAPVLDGA